MIKWVKERARKNPEDTGHLKQEREHAKCRARCTGKGVPMPKVNSVCVIIHFGGLEKGDGHAPIL